MIKKIKNGCDRMVGVVAHNNGDILYQCLASLGVFTTAECQFAFVDNGSEDDSVEHFREFINRFGNGILIENGENVGCNEAWNQLFEQAREWSMKYLYLLNSDIQVLRPGWDDELLERMEDDKAVVEACGVLYHPGGPLQHVGSAATLYRMSALHDAWIELNGEILTEPSRIAQHQAPMIGPWDTHTFPAWEGDMDLFNRLSRAGWYPALAKQGVHVLHLRGRTERALDRSAEGGFEQYQRKWNQLLLAKWSGTSYQSRWWDFRRNVEQCVEECPNSDLYPWRERRTI